MKKRYFILAILLVVVLVASAVYVIPMLTDNSASNEATTEETTIEEAQNKPVTNQPATTPTTAIVIPEETQEIIDTNSDYLYEDTDDALAPDYPTQMIPLYDVLGVSQSQAMTGVSGKPGWLTSYVSDDSTEELLEFYRPLLMTMSDFSEENISASTNLKATVSGYSISITVSPNNSQKTDIQGNGAVSIFIEQV
ncbi:hypothetical protein [Acetobacterium bakii]|uniref:Uncharacterized protein n=1 Tax=Acetobacterium bakii TaxID=52689 RepID=A0A0L6U1H1_9FIRM|nr:hypothetical protein [Acetobacterium bakii]KNZ42207.1 hypothetical protein AKG39_07440 [Acetobacterium bakii]